VDRKERAQGNDPEKELRDEGFKEHIRRYINFLIVWSGIRLILSGGDAKQVQSARQTMTYAIVGLIVVLSSFTIVLFIGYLTGTSDCITDVNKIITGCQ